MLESLPNKGVVFWPVGTGDSTTISVTKDIIVQVDLHHLEKSEDEDDPHIAIVDELKDLLPEKNGKPFLELFVLTHPDEDHIKGFSDLLDSVEIGELWFTPRIFREYKKDLCEDASVFKKEAYRRVNKVIDNDGDVESGDRVRLIGYDDLLEDEDFRDFPDELLTIPGNVISIINGKDYVEDIEAFIHAPFKDDSAGERNETSVVMRVLLKEGDKEAKVFLLGDLSYPTIRKIFDISDEDSLKWDVFLSPHHCSKSVMYQKDDKGNDELKHNILDDIKETAEDFGYIISSSEPIPDKNEPNDNPPHAKAKHRYKEIVPKEFICTQEHPNEKNPEPIIFELTPEGITYESSNSDKGIKKSTLAVGIEKARGKNEPPTSRTGFGK